MFNYDPYPIPVTNGIQTASEHMPTYSINVRRKIIPLVMSTAQKDTAYHSRWLFDMDWATDGTRLHKRIFSAVRKECGVKLDDDLLQTIAQISSEERETHYYYDVTDSFTWNPGDFGEAPNSCYWSQYRSARVTYLPKLGTVALRTFDKPTGGKGTGRAWLTPVPPTTQNGPVTLIAAWNFYGALQNGDNMTTMLAGHLGDDWVFQDKPAWSDFSVENCHVNNSRAIMIRHKSVQRAPGRIDITMPMILGSKRILPQWAETMQY